MGSKTSSQTNQQQSTQANPVAAAALDQTIARGLQVAQTPYSQFQGELTAGVNGQENSAIANYGTTAANTNATLGQAATGLNTAANTAVNPTALGAAQIGQFSNPYQQSVINATQGQIANQDAIQSQQNISNSIGAGAFGGDRAGISQAALQGQQAIANNATLANLNSANYSQALGAAQQQQATTLSAGQANRAAALQGAEGLASIGSASNSANLADTNASLAGGVLQQQTAQASDTAQYGQFQQAAAFPYAQTAFQSAIVDGNAPLLGGTTTGQSTTATSPLNALFGGLTGAAALAPSASTISSGLGSLGSLFSLSDERAKENIQPVGKTFDGQNLYSYRLKGEPQTHIGLIAQEVEKKHPHAVGSLGDAKVVDYAEATRKASDKGHFAQGGRTLGDAQHFAGGGAALYGAPVGSTPYAAAQDYVPTIQGLGGARLATPTLNFAKPATAGQPAAVPNLGTAATALSNSGIGDAISDYAQDRARGGGVVGLGGARRGYDTGGVVGIDGLMFDPTAVGSDTSFTPGVGPSLAAVPQGFAPDASAVPSNDNADVPTPPPRPRGLGTAAAVPDAATPSTGLSGAIPNLPAYVPQSPNPGASAFTGPTGTLGDAATMPTGVSNGLGAINSAAPSSQQPMGGAWNGDYADKPGMESYIRAAAVKNGVDPNAALAVARSEGFFTYAGDGGSSQGPFQLHYANVNPDMPNAGMGDDFTKATGLDARDPSTVKQQIDFAMSGVAKNGWGAWSGARNMGLTGSMGVNGAPIPDDVAGRMQNGSALGYAGSSSAPTGLGGAGASSGQTLSQGLAGSGGADNRTGGLGNALGFDPGGDGGLLGLSDNARMALLNAGASMMSSTSRSPGIALGEGLQGGLRTYEGGLDRDRKTGLARASIANTSSEIQNRGALQGVERDKVKVAQAELSAHLQQIRQEGENFKSEDAYRKQEGSARLTDAASVAQKAATERYMLIPGPDGEYRYLDRANPGAGMLTPGQVSIMSSAEAAATRGPPTASPAAASTGSPSTATGDAPSPGPAPAGSTASPAATGGPSSLDSSHFMTTGNPTLAAPQGYKPANYYGAQLRMQTDPVAREAAQKQTASDVTEANERAQKAYSSTFYSDEMDKNAAALPNSGLLVPGGAFPERLDLAKNWNAAMTGLGLDSFTVDPNASKAGEALVKDKARLGAQLTSSLGSREAATVFGSMMSAVPGGDNSRAGYKAVSSSIRALAQRDIDRNAFYQDYTSRYGSTNGAEPAFNQLNPAMGYAKQAQALARIPQGATDLLRSSANDPRAIAGFERQYGPGTARYFTGQFAR